MNRHCEDCRHWIRDTPPIVTTFEGDVLSPAHQPWGICTRLGHEDSLLRVEDGVDVRTDQHFSCNQWQSK